MAINLDYYNKSSVGILFIYVISCPFGVCSNFISISKHVVKK